MFILLEAKSLCLLKTDHCVLVSSNALYRKRRTRYAHCRHSLASLSGHLKSPRSQHNIAFIWSYIHTEWLMLAAKDVGDRCPRKVPYFPAIGKILMKKIARLTYQHDCR